MLFDYSNVIIFALVGIGFVFTSLLIGSLVRPQVPTLEKLSTYECGEDPVGSAWVNFNIRYYVVALVFVVFDVEIAFMFPVARVFKSWIEKGAAESFFHSQGFIALVEILVFLIILAIGFVYVWVKGDLDWVKKISAEVKSK